MALCLAVVVADTLKCPNFTHSKFRLRRLRGWNANMEFADLLRVLWCGIGRDMAGSLLLDTAEFCSHQA